MMDGVVLTPGAQATASPGRADAGVRPLQLLTFSTLYPHAGRPNHGIFVENRLRHVVATGQAESVVIAPVPWFPSSASRFGTWAVNARAARHEERHGISIFHPRYAQLPRVGMSVAPFALAAAGALQVRRLLASGLDVDLIDGHYVYPDGVAAVLLGRMVGKPVVLTARGSDITQYPDYRLPRRMVQWAMAEADALISVSAGLKRAMVQLGAPCEKVSVLRNGVDLNLFAPSDPAAARAEWRASGPVLLSVGHLIERKGHHLAIQALRDLPGWTLVLIGEGPEHDVLERLAVDLGLRERVIFAGTKPHAALAGYYGAADVLILASSREGWANVLLEAMACGTPVVASNIPGNSEVVASPEAGEVVAENTPNAFAVAVNRVYQRRTNRALTRSYAENFSWDATSQGQLQLFRCVLQRRAEGHTAR